MHDALVNRFYTALGERDGETMAKSYHSTAVFEDPVFGELQANDAADMWRMLCSSDTDLKLTHTIQESTNDLVVANWIAEYTFSATGNSVRNDVTARLKFKDGKIVDHRDDFDFWKWSSQALGLPGRLLGWTPMLRAKVRKTTAANLTAFQAQQNS